MPYINWADHDQVTLGPNGEALRANSSPATEPLLGWGWATSSVNTLTGGGDHFEFHIYREGNDASGAESLNVGVSRFNADLVAAGFSEGTIIRRIQNSPVDFDLSAKKIDNPDSRTRTCNEFIVDCFSTALWHKCCSLVSLYSTKQEQYRQMDAKATAIYSPSIRLAVAGPLFAACLFTSASLLFWVQPLIAKMLLPLLGGAPSIWNTCMVFFQALLLAGYAYALILSKRLRLRNQAFLHIALLLAAGIFLPFGVAGWAISSVPTKASPVPWLLGVLLITVGPPFFVLSATAPLLQKWFSHSDHPSAKDPYFLYAVSNAGSMASLLAFPFLLEPTLNIRQQGLAWAAGYLMLAVLITACAITIRQKANRASSTAVEEAPESITWRGRASWLVLAFVPSSLMLGLTTYISTDVASLPLIWILPLAIYLLTFVMAFAGRQLLSLRIASLLLPALIVILGIFLILKSTPPILMILPLHLVLFFLAAFICHRRLALARPTVSRLPEYYLWIAFGGVVGGIFNALLAPLLFSASIEYPLVLVLACALRPKAPMGVNSRWWRIAFPPFILLLIIGLALLVPSNIPESFQTGLTLCLPLALCYLAAPKRPAVFALSLLAFMVGAHIYWGAQERLLRRERNFFGVWKVTESGNGAVHELKHGTTAHGFQFTDVSRKCNPQSYYHKSGPLGQVFEAYNARANSRYVAVVGLGAGTMMSYALPNEQWDLYEIDPAVVRLASDPQYFTYLSDCAAAPYQVILGDARSRLRQAPDHHYGLILFDAFSSDAIPAHLVTLEALNSYFSKTTDAGLIAFHISNRYLNLEPLLSGLSIKTGLSGFIRTDLDDDFSSGKYSSVWVVMTRNEASLGPILNDSRWQRLQGNIVWTDDFSNLLGVLK